MEIPLIFLLIAQMALALDGNSSLEFQNRSESSIHVSNGNSFRMPLMAIVDSFLKKLDQATNLEESPFQHPSNKNNEAFNSDENEEEEEKIPVNVMPSETSNLTIHILDTGECEMLNGSLGECQTTQRCLSYERESGAFSLCEWSQHPITGVRTPLKLCCRKIPKDLESELIEKENQGIKLTSKAFHWFPSFQQFQLGDFSNNSPYANYIRCGQTLYTRQHRRHIARHVLEIPSRWKKVSTKTEQEGTNSTIIPQPRIVSGVSVGIGEIPWIVSIYLRDQFVCGGSFINERFVLTAAHCFASNKQPRNYYIRYGNIVLHEGPAIPAKKIAVHPGYNPPVIYHDIALIELSQPVRFTNTIQPVCLATSQMYGSNMVGLKSTVAGFGDSNFEGKQADFLQAVDIKIIDNQFCDQNYRRLSESHKKFRYGIGNSLICAGYEEGVKDACQGDSGGPLTIELAGTNYLIGIVSFGFRCAQPMFPGIYTSVAHYRPWIDIEMQNANLF